jgi:Na+/H+ antiporter NhaD/arsenite permease-like protein
MGLVTQMSIASAAVLSLDQALHSIDFDTIALLLGMMIVVGNLRLSGFFRLVTNWVASHPLLLVPAMAATLAGNLTILGSVANLIVVQRAARRGVTIGFWQYFRVGAPVTVLTILVGLWWL